MSLLDEDQIYKKIVDIAGKYHLDPRMLRDILTLRNRGMNNSDIANYMGIHRNTVNRYVNALDKMDKIDLGQLLTLVAIIGAGVLIIGALLESISKGDR